MDGPQRPKLVESSADHPGIRRIICLMTLNNILCKILTLNTCTDKQDRPYIPL